MFWKLLPLIIEVVRHAGGVAVERYRAMKAAEERRKAEALKRTQPVRESETQNTGEK
jgi:hypothetical protein